MQPKKKKNEKKTKNPYSHNHVNTKLILPHNTFLTNILFLLGLIKHTNQLTFPSIPHSSAISTLLKQTPLPTRILFLSLCLTPSSASARSSDGIILFPHPS